MCPSSFTALLLVCAKLGCRANKTCPCARDVCVASFENLRWACAGGDRVVRVRLVLKTSCDKSGPWQSRRTSIMSPAREFMLLHDGRMNDDVFRTYHRSQPACESAHRPRFRWPCAPPRLGEATFSPRNILHSRATKSDFQARTDKAAAPATGFVINLSVITHFPLKWAQTPPRKPQSFNFRQALCPHHTGLRSHPLCCHHPFPSRPDRCGTAR